MPHPLSRDFRIRFSARATVTKSSPTRLERATTTDSTSSSTMTITSIPVVDSTGRKERPFEDQAANPNVGVPTPLSPESAESVNTSELPVPQSAVASSEERTSNDEPSKLRVIHPEPVVELTEPPSTPLPAQHPPAPQATEEAPKELYREVFPADLPPRPPPKRNFFARLFSKQPTPPVDIELANRGAQQPATDGMVDVDLGNQTSSNHNWRPKRTFNHTLLRNKVLLALIGAAFVMFVLWGMAIVYQNSSGGGDGEKGAGGGW